MTMQYATLTGPITLPGSDIGVRARITATPLTTDQELTFTGDDRITIGPVVGESNGAGALVNYKIPTNVDIVDQLWHITAERLDRGPGPTAWTIGNAVSITGTGTIKLRDLVEVDVTTLNAQTYAHLIDLVNTAESARDAAEDSQVAAEGSRVAAEAAATTAAAGAEAADAARQLAESAAGAAVDEAIVSGELVSAADDRLLRTATSAEQPWAFTWANKARQIVGGLREDGLFEFLRQRRPDGDLTSVPSSVYLRTRVDSKRRLAEDALGADGTIPAWVVDRIAARAGLARVPLRSVVVNPDGSGDFTTIRAALDSITDSSWRNPVAMVIHPGVYAETSLPHKEGIWWLGTNRKACWIRGELAASSNDTDITNTSTIDWSADGVLANLTVTAKNMRYAIHVDGHNGTKDYSSLDSRVRGTNVHLEHYGNGEARAWRDANPGSGLLSANVWANERPWGYGTSSGWDVELEDSTLIGNDAFTIHDFDDFENGSTTRLRACRLIGTKSLSVLSISAFGAGRPSVLTFDGCEITAAYLYYSDTSFRSEQPEALIAGHDYTVTVTGGKHEPLGFYPAEVAARALKITSAATTAPSTVAVSGTAAAVLFGAQAVRRDGGAGLAGYVYGHWDISGRLTGNAGDVVVANTLGRRLGDCSTTSKTLTVTVNGGAPVNIVFNTNLTAVSNATILATINTALGAAATASEYDVVTNEFFPNLVNDTRTHANADTVAIGRFQAVKKSGRGIALFTTADAATSFYGVALEPIQPGAVGRILTRGRLRSGTTGVQQIPGVSANIAPGATIYHSDTTSGQFATTGTRPAMTGVLTNWAEF